MHDEPWTTHPLPGRRRDVRERGSSGGSIDLSRGRPSCRLCSVDSRKEGRSGGGHGGGGRTMTAQKGVDIVGGRGTLIFVFGAKEFANEAIAVSLLGRVIHVWLRFGAGRGRVEKRAGRRGITAETMPYDESSW